MSLHQKGQLPEAASNYQEVLARDPRNFDALRLLGGLYVQWDKADKAVPCLQEALTIAPNNTELLHNLGVALGNQGQDNAAIAQYRRVVAIAPNHIQAIDSLGNLLFASGQLDEATVWLKRSTQLNQKNGRAHACLGDIFRAHGETLPAITHYRQAHVLLPDNTAIMHQLGNLLRQVGMSDEACAVYQRLAAHKPDDAAVQRNLGVILRDMGQLEESLRRHDIALQLAPDAPDTRINRASLLLELDRPEEARAAYDDCVRRHPDRTEARWGKALALLTLGAYPEGWALYESRLEHMLKRNLPAPRWNGSALDGKKLLIWGEQGLGDVLQFIRYAKICKDKGGHITVQCARPLARLLAQCPSIDAVVHTTEETHYDYHIPVMSLPHICGTTLETIPHDTPYLFVDDESRAKWAPLFSDPSTFKIGLVWAGNPRTTDIDAHVTDRQRSMPLATMRPLFSHDSCRFYSLQKENSAAAIAAAGLDGKLVDPMPQVEDLMDTAAIITHLDLVISVDTSVVHLTGGLGKPVWVLSRFGGCWRWLRNRASNPWYPTARIFGQPAPGDWSGCVADVSTNLATDLQKQSPVRLKT